MQQATYRSRRSAQDAMQNPELNARGLISLLIGELAALASLSLTLIGGLLLAASYVL